MKKTLSPSQEAFKVILYESCLRRYKQRKKRVKVEVLPYGIADGSVDTFVERGTAGWGSSYGGMGMDNLRKKK